jgi:hypothetical protein
MLERTERDGILAVYLGNDEKYGLDDALSRFDRIRYFNILVHGLCVTRLKHSRHPVLFCSRESREIENTAKSCKIR